MSALLTGRSDGVVASEDCDVFERPGEVHTLTVDDEDKVVHVEDNIGLIELARERYGPNGLGADFVDQFIRYRNGDCPRPAGTVPASPHSAGSEILK